MIPKYGCNISTILTPLLLSMWLTAGTNVKPQAQIFPDLASAGAVDFAVGGPEGRRLINPDAYVGGSGLVVVPFWAGDRGFAAIDPETLNLTWLYRSGEYIPNPRPDQWKLPSNDPRGYFCGITRPMPGEKEVVLYESLRGWDGRSMPAGNIKSGIYRIDLLNGKRTEIPSDGPDSLGQKLQGSPENWSPDGRWVLPYGQPLHLLDPKTFDKRLSLKLFPFDILAANNQRSLGMFSRDGLRYALYGGSNLCLWDLGRFSRKRKETPVVAIRLDGANGWRKVEIPDDPPQQRSAAYVEDLGMITWFEFSPSGKRAAILGHFHKDGIMQRRYDALPTMAATLWDLAKNTPIDGPEDLHRGFAGWGADDDHIFLSGRDGVSVWNLRSGKADHILRYPEGTFPAGEGNGPLSRHRVLWVPGLRVAISEVTDGNRQTRLVRWRLQGASTPVVGFGYGLAALGLVAGLAALLVRKKRALKTMISG